MLLHHTSPFLHVVLGIGSFTKILISNSYRVVFLVHYNKVKMSTKHIHTRNHWDNISNHRNVGGEEGGGRLWVDRAKTLDKGI